MPLAAYETTSPGGDVAVVDCDNAGIRSRCKTSNCVYKKGPHLQLQLLQLLRKLSLPLSSSNTTTNMQHYTSSLLAVLSASALVAASPIASFASTSNAFYLAANVTDAASALAAVVQGSTVTGYHASAGFSTAVLQKPDANSAGRVFYYNSSAPDAGDFLTDTGGAVIVPYGFLVQGPAEFSDSDNTEHSVYLQTGHGSNAALATSAPAVYVENPLAGTAGGSFVACNRSVPYAHSGIYGIAVQYVYAGATKPAECVSIELTPLCAPALSALPAGSLSTHEFAQTVPCYTALAASH